MARECIILVAGSFILKALGVHPPPARKDEVSTKCIGPECGQYNIFNNFCGFSK